MSFLDLFVRTQKLTHSKCSINGSPVLRGTIIIPRTCVIDSLMSFWKIKNLWTPNHLLFYFNRSSGQLLSDFLPLFISNILSEGNWIIDLILFLGLERGQERRGDKPQVLHWSTAIFILALTLVLINFRQKEADMTYVMLRWGIIKPSKWPGIWRWVGISFW